MAQVIKLTHCNIEVSPIPLTRELAIFIVLSTPAHTGWDTAVEGIARMTLGYVQSDT